MSMAGIFSINDGSPPQPSSRTLDMFAVPLSPSPPSAPAPASPAGQPEQYPATYDRSRMGPGTNDRNITTAVPGTADRLMEVSPDRKANTDWLGRKFPKQFPQYGYSDI
jgi:hypothetical protein